MTTARSVVDILRARLREHPLPLITEATHEPRAGGARAALAALARRLGAAAPEPQPTPPPPAPDAIKSGVDRLRARLRARNAEPEAAGPASLRPNAEAEPAPATQVSRSIAAPAAVAEAHDVDDEHPAAPVSRGRDPEPHRAAYPATPATEERGVSLLRAALARLRRPASESAPGVPPSAADAAELVTAAGAAPAGEPVQPILGEVAPDLWTQAQRQKANLAAMRLAAELARAPRELTDDDRRTLGAYSGWGGLSLEAVADKFPEGFPAPEERGLIHEYYTPTRVCSEVARVVRPLLAGLARDGKVLALEPSAGIGRFVRAFSGPGFEDVVWRAVEYSELSAAMLQALRPDIEVFRGSFERWVADNERDMAGAIDLVVSNPPYGRRGASIATDPARAYRYKNAYAYFLRRGLDLLAPGGLGVYLIPAGFLTGTSDKHVALRTEVLRRHHLSAAYRLPSRLFPGALLVTDLLFFRSRGGALAEVDDADRFIIEGKYFVEYPSHILGTEVGTAGDDDDQTAKPRWGYEVVGEFTALPDFDERPMCAACQLVQSAPPARRARALGVGAREVADAAELDPRLVSASTLGLRVDAFLAEVAAQDSEEPSLAWEELHRGLVEWATAHGAPSLDVELVKLANSGDVGAQRFLSAFEPRTTSPIPALRTRPVWSPRYQGRPDDIVAYAEFLYRQHRTLSRADLGDVDFEPLFRAGWCEDEPGELVPADVYFTGDLWPKYDRAKARADEGDSQAANQARRLMERIAPVMFDEVPSVSPREGWVPLDLIEKWMTVTLNHGLRVGLVRQHGLLQTDDAKYEDLEDRTSEVIQCIGWINHDKTLFRPSKAKDGDDDEDEDETNPKRHAEAHDAEQNQGKAPKIDELRLAKAREWEQSFRAWCGADEGRREQIERAYQRTFQGYRTPEFSAAPLRPARWTKTGPKLHAYQSAGTRRVIANRGGLVAYDVGLGKTYTGLAILASARQEGWAKRPVVVVPNSIVWKWAADIRRVLPDYRVGVVGSKRKVIKRGARKGYQTSETDSPAERAATWTRFQGGEYDVVLVTYSALGRTRISEDFVREYAEHTAAIQREIKLRQRNAQGKKKLTEREKAILNEGVAAWVAQQMEIPEEWSYDPGITWDDIGVDFLLVDEAQNFKNKYLPEAREGGVPRFMGNSGEGAWRAWQLDFRCASVRAKTGGAGIVLLSATPAKNSPLELYSLLTYIDPDAFARRGITDPEQFIDRYLRIELSDVVDSKMEVVKRSAVTGFQNLDDLRDVLGRYSEFRTAEEVGLKVPEPEPHLIEVDLDARQEAKYARYVAEVEALLMSPGESKGELLGYLTRMALVAVHADLDEKYDWTTAKNVPSPHSPKFDALAREITSRTNCGHIVFCDNVAAHVWIRMVLEEAGVPPKRIAVLNAKVAKAAADRQRIAQDFNGNPDEGIAPKYDVVIANAIAYEGVDLQTRTCAIHHLDFPWEPATLEQRNGRGRRQGNTRAAVAIIYYFARRSQDGMRFNLIQGKRGWMVELFKGHARDTNNPGAQMNLSPEEILMLISRDPEKTAARYAAAKARREAEARKKIAREASTTLKHAAARFTRARAVSDPVEAARLRSEAEQRLEDLARVDPKAWPWAPWAYAARDHGMVVPPDGQSPVYEGLRVATPNVYDPTLKEYGEFGLAREGKTIGLRRAGAVVWKEATIQDVIGLNLLPEHATTAWPADDEERMDQAMGHVLVELGHGPAARRAWLDLGWSRATDAFVERAWARYGADIIGRLNTLDWYRTELEIPVIARGALAIGLVNTFDSVVPPTKAGWAEFLRLAPTSGAKFSELEEAGHFWWGLTIPRNLLSAAREATPPSKKPSFVAKPLELIEEAAKAGQELLRQFRGGATKGGTVAQPAAPSGRQPEQAATGTSAGSLAPDADLRPLVKDAIERAATATRLGLANVGDVVRELADRGAAVSDVHRTLFALDDAGEIELRPSAGGEFAGANDGLAPLGPRDTVFAYAVPRKPRAQAAGVAT